MYVCIGLERDRKKFTRARSAARRPVRLAKDAWFQRKATEAERGKSGRLVWQCIRDIQNGRRGLVPFRSAAVRDEDDNVWSTPDMQQQRW